MKQFWLYKHVFLWSMLLIAAVLVPRLALSAEPCERKASANLQKRSVEMEMAVIAGDLSELELVGKKESLFRQAKRDKELCRRTQSARGPAARTEGVSL